MAKPKIRFKGYTDDWEQRKFGDLVEKYEDPIDTPTDGYMRLGIRSHAKGTFHSYVEKGKELETAKMFRVAANNFIVNITFGWEHAVAITDESDAGKLVSHRFPQYSFENGMIPMFFKCLILDENFKHHLELSSPGGAGRNRVLKLNDMLEYKMKFPCEDEQRKLASYFDDLDHLITLHQRKCEETKKLKKYMLQKMFPQNGQTVPEIRFAGFTDAWEQRKLGEIASSFEYGLNAAAKEYDGENKYIRITDIDDNTHEFLTYNLTSPDIDLTDAENYKLAEGDILFARTGASVGKSYIYRDSDGLVYYAGFLIRARIREEYDAEFVFQSTLTDKYNKYIAVTSQRSGQPGVNAQEYSEFEIRVPEKEEQTKIGTYFRNLDHLITLHQHKCEELQNMKKFMLQNMFV